MSVSLTRNLHLHHASLQWKDEDQRTAEDMRRALSLRAPVVSFTEVFPGNQRWLNVVAEEKGYVPFMAGNDALAVRKNVKVLDQGEILVNPGVKGKPPAGGHSQRHALWVQMDLWGESVFYVTAHWVTGYKHFKERRDEHDAMSTAIVDLVQSNGKGKDLAFFAGDTNVPDSEGVNPGFVLLDEGGLTTCWDELGVYPATHGQNNGPGKTIDVIGSYDRDGRVSCDKARAWPKVAADHNPISAWYKIKQRRG
jgi:endonuclease/exonuclease/phosphatase (EEP) superfamily protein YafD